MTAYNELEWRDIVAALNAIQADSPEDARIEADRILLAAVKPQVAAAHQCAINRAVYREREATREGLQRAYR